ncbi:MAG: DUF2796 domain-containing protein [Rickettsiales bacterium]|jgi:hypothetical protein|nr:DUF2796 domain-containing protein [Rickettsiales bacterium]
MKKVVFFLLILCLLSTVFAEEHKHEHGISSINVVVEKNNVSIEIDAPFDDFLGFEHKPENNEEEQEVKKMSIKLKKANFFVLPSCKLQSVELEKYSPSGEEHDDIEVEYSYKCSKISTMEIKIFSEFPNVKKLKIQVVGKKSQKYYELEKDGVIKIND